MDLSSLLANAVLAFRRGDPMVAHALLSEGIVDYPTDARLYAARANCEWTERRFVDAASDIAQAIQLEPWRLRHWHSFAACLIADGRRADAAYVYERMRAFRPNDPKARILKDGGEVNPAIVALAQLMREPTLSACLIVKNEEASIEACLNSLRPVCDEIVVLDTGSTDRTVEIAQSLGAKIGHFAWVDDFSAARNASIAMATGDWILAFDADATLDAGSYVELRAVICDDHKDAFSVVMDNELDDGKHAFAQVVRVFRNQPTVRYESRIHEQIVPSINRAGYGGGQTRIVIHHDGYRHAIVGSKDKLARNERLLKLELAASPDDPYWLYQLGKNHMMADDKCAARAAFHRACLSLAAVENCSALPYAEDLYAAASRLLLAAGAFDEAIAVADVGARTFPRSPDIAYYRGQALLELDRQHDAARCFEVTETERQRLRDPSLLPLARAANALLHRKSA